MITSPAGQTVGAVIAINLISNYITDLTKLVYRRLCGLSEKAETDEVKKLLKERPGDIDGLADSIEEDLIRLHRPLDGAVNNFYVYGGQVNVGTFDQRTYDFVKTKELGSSEEVFIGNVAALNGNTVSGRLWIDQEQRTVSFKQDRSTKLPTSEKKLLSWSLDRYVNEQSGKLAVTGIPLRSKQGMLKTVFATKVRKA